MTKFVMKKLYDPEQGRPVREIKSTDIFHLATSGTVTGSAGTILATTTTSTNKVLFITAFAAGASTVGDIGGVLVTVGNSTILPMIVPGDNTKSITGDVNSPLYKVDCTSAQTISIRAIHAGTYTAWLTGVYHPIFSKVETA